MCGIGAIYGSNIKKNSIKKSLSKIEHRGYSNYEIKNLDKCSLGCNRLQIVDRHNAVQPISNEDETVFVVLNGEIFNFKELTKELIKKGHKFSTNSDTETLVHLWEEYGENMVYKIDSEIFAFFIYDKKKSCFFAARDPYGVKPLYFSFDKKGNYHFASEIKQLAQFKEIEEINHFPPGHYMINGNLKQYHKIPGLKKKLKTSKKEIIPRLRELFDKAIKERVDTDLPVGVFFSGGIDSGAVLATALKYHSNVTAITIGQPDSPDMAITKKYCKEKNIKLITFEPPKEEDLIDLIPEIVKITESFEPNMIRVSAIYYYLAKLARDHKFKIILCGEGPDEVFAGYPEFETLDNSKEISKKILDFVKDLPRTQFQMVDRVCMNFTLEVRVPFFDTEFVDYSLRIPSELKVKNAKGKKVVKWILREAMKDRLPEYIFNRPKVVLHEGAGYGGNKPTGGMFYDAVAKLVTDKKFSEIKRKYGDWGIKNKEEAYYFKLFKKNHYDKAKFNKQRVVVNKINSLK